MPYSNKPWHHGSVFGPGSRNPLTRERKARWTYLIHAHTRAGHITPKGEWVATELGEHLSRDGRCDPSYERLAADADVGVSTVGRAIKDMSIAGLLRWQRRIERSTGRTRQTSNAYELLVPGDADPRPTPRPPPLPKSLKNLESGSTLDSNIATGWGVGLGVLPGHEARFAAKLAEEKRLRAARAVAGVRR